MTSTFLKLKGENIPGELKAQKIWVCWKGVPVKKDDGNTRMSKVPIMPDGREAKVNDPSTWSEFWEAAKAYNTGKCDGIGIVLVDPYVGYDQDHCKLTRGELAETAKEDLLDLMSYSEISPSGEGIRVIIKGKKPGTICKRGEFEMYDSSRYMTITGHVLTDYPTHIRENQEGINKVYARRFNGSQEEEQKAPRANVKAATHSDKEIIEKAERAKNGWLFKWLYGGGKCKYPSDSEADLAFCDILAFYTQEENQIKRILLSSGRGREKLNREDYISKTIDRALSHVKDTYSWQEEKTQEGGGEKPICYLDPESGRYKLDAPEIARTIVKEMYLVKATNRIDPLGAYEKGVYRLGLPATAVIKHRIQKMVDDLFMNANIDPPKLLTPASRANILGHIDGRAELIDPIEWDRYPDFLCVANGVIFLPTGELLPWNPEFHLTAKVNLNYKPEAQCPQFLAWLETVQPEPEARRYLQKLAGTYLFDRRFERALYIFWGDHDNGKTLFQETMRLVVGELYEVAKKCILTQGRDDEAESELSKLEGKRVVTIFEMERHETLAEGRTKHCIGNDPIPARRKHGRPFTYIAGWTAVLVTNYMPKTQTMAPAIVNKLRIIPWNVNIPLKKQDPNYLNRMVGEREGILTWMVEGAKMVATEGMDIPPWMEEMIGEYRIEGDPLNDFTVVCLEQKYNAKAYGSELFETYKIYMKSLGPEPLNWTAFGRALTDKHPLKDRDEKGVYYKNLEINPAWRKKLEERERRSSQKGGGIGPNEEPKN